MATQDNERLTYYQSIDNNISCPRRVCARHLRHSTSSTRLARPPTSYTNQPWACFTRCRCFVEGVSTVKSQVTRARCVVVLFEPPKTRAWHVFCGGGCVLVSVVSVLARLCSTAETPRLRFVLLLQVLWCMIRCRYRCLEASGFFVRGAPNCSNWPR